MMQNLSELSDDEALAIEHATIIKEIPSYTDTRLIMSYALSQYRRGFLEAKGFAERNYPEQQRKAYEAEILRRMAKNKESEGEG